MEFLTLEDVTDRLCRNVVKVLLLYAASHRRRAQILTLNKVKSLEMSPRSFENETVEFRTTVDRKEKGNARPGDASD